MYDDTYHAPAAQRPWLDIIRNRFDRREMPELTPPWYLVPLIEECRRLFSDHQWHRREEIHELARMHGLQKTPIDAIGEWLFLAESDSGRWLCRPTRETPELAPDGT